MVTDLWRLTIGSTYRSTGVPESTSAKITSEKLSQFAYFRPRDHFLISEDHVRAAGLLGSRPSSPTNLGGVGRLTGAAGW